MLIFKVGDKVRWHIRPEVHIEHGGYTSTTAMEGEVRSLHYKHIMVGTGERVLIGGRGLGTREITYSVLRANPSLRKL